ncbi:MAG: acyl carrier protein [Flavobacterium sp.]|uniref:acyl carrier protein n=1 Tax=Flavobacterium sp. TaxID=239 RepID=UPI0011F6AD25|nr:acyl carrier protein [Flavobacterium sp.]RZJ66055.1 MAG: acyl carrier protein [Flavobacterium sp.]
MTTAEFISGLHEELEFDAQLTESTNLKDLDEWDSMAAMVLIGYVSNNLDITLTADDLKEITTVSSLIDRIGADKFN